MSAQTTTHRFTVKTWAESKSNRRDRTYVIDAATGVDAKNEAIERACTDMRQWGRSVFTTIVDVDGRGAPVDCPHSESRTWDGFVWRTDGGRDCHSCATKPNPAWVGCSVLDLIAAADKDEEDAVSVANHPHATSEDFDLAAFKLDRAADMRAEIARRTA